MHRRRAPPRLANSESDVAGFTSEWLSWSVQTTNAFFVCPFLSKEN